MLFPNISARTILGKVKTLFQYHFSHSSMLRQALPQSFHLLFIVCVTHTVLITYMVYVTLYAGVSYKRLLLLVRDYPIFVYYIRLSLLSGRLL